MKNTRTRFGKLYDALALEIQESWVKRSNEIGPKEPPRYPKAITWYVNAQIAGRKKLFAIHIRAASKYAKP